MARALDWPARRCMNKAGCSRWALREAACVLEREGGERERQTDRPTDIHRHWEGTWETRGPNPRRPCWAVLSQDTSASRGFPRSVPHLHENKFYKVD